MSKNRGTFTEGRIKCLQKQLMNEQISKRPSQPPPAAQASVVVNMSDIFDEEEDRSLIERLADMAAVIDGNPGILMLEAAKEIKFYRRLAEDMSELITSLCSYDVSSEIPNSLKSKSFESLQKFKEHRVRIKRD